MSGINEEKILVKGCIDGNIRYQRMLYELYSGKMMLLCMRYSRDRQEAEDLLQEGFIRVFERINTFRHSGSLEGWIRKILVNMAIRHYHKNRKSISSLSIEEIEDPGEEVMDIQELPEMEDLLRMIQQLPEGYRMIFNLYNIEGYSHKMIAGELGISEGTSKSQYSRARKMLREMINEYKSVRTHESLTR